VQIRGVFENPGMAMHNTHYDQYLRGDRFCWDLEAQLKEDLENQDKKSQTLLALTTLRNIVIGMRDSTRA
jgi:hypothetical protein